MNFPFESRTSETPGVCRRQSRTGSRRHERQGIILLVVLGMLTLFSVLAVSYLVFTGRQRAAAASLSLAENAEVDNNRLLDDALRSIVVGANGPNSSLWGHDILGDLFGSRDAIEALPAPWQFLSPIDQTAPDALLGNQLLRMPTMLHIDGDSLNAIFNNNPPIDLILSLPDYPYRRNDQEIDRRYPGYVGPVGVVPFDKATNYRRLPSFPMDDELAGRFLTFREGPLANLTLPIVRSFGDHRDLVANGTPVVNGRSQLSGQLILDVRHVLGESVTIGELTKTLAEWLDPANTANFNPASLFYDSPPNKSIQQMIADNDRPEPYGSFYINGRMLNGPGMGWDRPRGEVVSGSPPSNRPHIHTVRGIDRQRAFNATTNPLAPFNLNEVVSTELDIVTVEKGGYGPFAVNDTRPVNLNPVVNIPFQIPTGPFAGVLPLRAGPDIPVALQPHYALHRLAPNPDGTGNFEFIEQFLQDLPPGDTDEPYDAADYNNMFLSYFPTDELLGEAAPSFVRPALINWIVNNVVEDGATPTVGRLRQALIALQRSTMRPIPLRGAPTTPINVADRGVGVKNLSFAEFSGGNTSDGLSEPIDFTSNNVNYLRQKVVEVAQALVGRDTDGDQIIDTWDVDNNGDGRDDSVWIDAGSSLQQSVTGQWYKPMVSYLVEDLGGRVNVNLAGNIVQSRQDSNEDFIRRSAVGALQSTNPQLVMTEEPGGANPEFAPAPVYQNVAGTPPPTTQASELASAGATRGLPSGWGYGPAEIDLRQIFLPFGTPLFPPASLDQRARDRARNGPQSIIAERLGIVSSTGRTPASNVVMDSQIPGGPLTVTSPGHLYDPISSLNLPATGNDFVGMIRRSGRPNLHNFAHPQGYPVDVFGRSSAGLDVSGGMVVSGASVNATNGGAYNGGGIAGAGDIVDDPYEFAGDAVNGPDRPFTYADLEPLLNNAGLDRDLLSQRLVQLIERYHSNPDLDGDGTVGSNEGPQPLLALRQALADSITTDSTTVATVKGGLPTEYFDDTVAATSAGGPQELIKRTFGNYDAQLRNQNASLGKSASEINAILWELMPDDLRAGRKMNLNRPFGNGHDDDGDGVIDDDHNGMWTTGPTPDAYLTTHLLNHAGTNSAYTTTNGTTVPGELLDTNTAAPGVRRNVSPRANFARHLYVMTMILLQDSSDPGDIHGFDFPMHYQGIAGFNSPFYDLNPATGNGYNATGTPATEFNGANTQQDQLDEFNREYRAWKVAQWAINVADFRDDDAVMSKFDYDPNPFDGWDVDLYDPRTYRTVWGMEYPELSLEESLAFHDRRVRDTDADPSGQKSLQGSDGNATRGDLTMDQYRIPQGSLFLEIRNNRSPDQVRTPVGSIPETDPVANKQALPSELYSSNGVNAGLNLGLLAPAGGTSAAVPVWRVAISEAHASAALDPTNSFSADRRPAVQELGVGLQTVPFAQSGVDTLVQPVGSGGRLEADAYNAGGVTIALDRDTTTLQPTAPQFFETIATGSAEERQRQFAIDRVVLFTPNLVASDNTAPTDIERIVDTLPEILDEGQVFYNQNLHTAYVNNRGNRYELLMGPGGYAVIGPRDVTHIGARQTFGGNDTMDPDTGQPLVNYTDYESPQTFFLEPNLFEYRGIDGVVESPIIEGFTAAVPNASIRPVIGIRAASLAPAAWGNQNQRIGLNVSEPLAYRRNTTNGTRQYYDEPTEALDRGQGFPVDAYRDYTDATPAPLNDEPFDSSPATSELHRVFGDIGVQTGTREHFKTAYLQRLADPTAPFHPEMNPYRTIDYITIDLTVFNGSDDNSESKTENGGGVLWVDAEDPDPFGSAPEEKFASRYKTGKRIDGDPTSGAGFDNLKYSFNTYPPVTTSQSPAVVAPELNFPHDLHIDPAIRGNLNNSLLGARNTHSTTIGYANRSYGPRFTQGPNAPGPTYNSAQESVSRFVGVPYQQYMKDVMWLNRPYVSAYELMWVPTSSAGRFGMEFGISDPGAGQTTTNQFNVSLDLNGSDVFPSTTPTTTAATAQPDVPSDVAVLNQDDAGLRGFNERFKHLWNFFSSSPVFRRTPTVAITTPYSDVPELREAPNLHRLLQWVGVGNPYDYEIDFFKPLVDPAAPLVNPILGGPIDMNTFGTVNYTRNFNQDPIENVNVNGDPRSWTGTVPSPALGYDPAGGIWSSDPQFVNEYRGFWTRHIALEPLRPPLNLRSKLFKSGLVNLNTIKNINVYKTVVAGYSTAAELDPTLTGRYPAGLGAFFNEFIATRRGYTPDLNAPSAANHWFEDGPLPMQTFDHDGNTGTPELPSFDRNIPTQFAGVFRSAMGSNIAPLESMRQRPIDPNDSPWQINEPGTPGMNGNPPAVSPDPEPRLEHSDIDDSLLVESFDRSGQVGKPVFQREPNDPAISAPESHVSSVINQQLGLTRLAELATDQSNLFAVWITVGNFEVDIDTLTVGDELGADRGEAVRTRGFYIIDRSQPVMYEPGVWNNARNAVVYERVE